MANKNNLLQYVAQKLGPEKLQEMVDQIEQELSQDPDVTPEVIDELIQQLGFVAENPDRYKEVVTYAAQAGAIDPADVPPEFDPIFVGVMLLALTELRDSRMAPQAFAKGGLAVIAAKGRGGDTMLAHINPREAEVLRLMGGSGTVNPNTGLREFKGGIVKSISKVIKSVAKIAVPAVATMVGGPWAGAAAGAAMGALSGGGIKGALMGGIGAAAMPGGLFGDMAKTLGTNVLGSSIGGLLSNVVGPETLGAGIIGAGAGALTGGLKGALAGGLTAGAGAAAMPGIKSATNVLQGGGGLTEAAKALMGGSANVSPGVELPAATGAPSLSIAPESVTGPGIPLSAFEAAAAPVAQAAAPKGVLGAFTPDANTLMKGMFALNALGGKTPQVAMQDIQNSALTEAQKQAMARNLTDYTANWNATTLPQAGTPEYDDMMKKINQGIGIDFMNPSVTTEPQPAMAKGGALTLLARGGGDGRSDSIHAKLSDGEYVIDAETVALLGNGSTKAGAAVLDKMRKEIRQQKGKALAKGKFSPNAKSPLAYMRGGL